MIKVYMINVFFMQINRFLHLLQRIPGLLRGSERVNECVMKRFLALQLVKQIFIFRDNHLYLRLAGNRFSELTDEDVENYIGDLDIQVI